jgi:acyl-coenzyme A thioesterase PaaI-like protein
MELFSEIEWAEKRRLAAAMRVIIEHLTRTDAPKNELVKAAEQLESFGASLARFPRRKGQEGYTEAANSGDVDAMFDHSPLIGLSNPLAPPLRLRVKDRRVVGTAVFGEAYEGPPGCVHGGFVAAAFDEVLGFAQSLSGSPGMTGTLEIRYRAPTPLHTELKLEAWVEKVEGRKIFARGTIHVETLLTAEAEGIFISVDAERFMKLIEQAEKRRREPQEGET